ncbi:tetratricopeptide repeat protein [Flavicella sediminum]|uniref:tetratricopeptide repeat protein n=1 Tax=Flavicella sediminum TaxID=2585141 RepID=UPI0011242FFE|nr:tetratricopeptide repeat protein [Flavicella sediminum]
MHQLKLKYSSLLGILFLFLLSCQTEKKETYKAIPKSEERPIFSSTKQIPDAHFLGDKKCKECHENQFEKWEGSHHDKSMDIATRETILADFKGEKFFSQGVHSRFFEKNGEFFANTEGPDGKNHDYKIEYVFGITPLQQYIVKFPDGHYQCLRTAWDSKKNIWFDLYPDFKVVHSEWLHWSRGGLNWNNMCADCHSTNVRKNYDQETHSYDTKFAIINVSCEACHGPGKQHVSDVATQGDNYRNTGTMQMTLETKPKELVDQCARCHMRREQISEKFNFEGTLLDHYYPQLITSPIYHADGQILDEDYVYGSFVQSKMYHNNVTCTNCHDAHTLERKFEGNKLCTQCHIKETYDTEKHHFHKNGTEGALCINCHMPGKFYMGNDFRRDHSFRIPRPDLSVKYGTPNACTGCHKDKDDTWAEAKFIEQHGKPDYTHFSELLAPGITNAPNAEASYRQLAKDTTQPEIARASAVIGLGAYRTQATVKELLSFLNDDSAMVRASTVDALNEINRPEYLNYFIPLLKDPKRVVRVKAFNALGSVKESQIPDDYLELYKKVAVEFETYLKITSDFVGGRVNRANYLIKQGDLKGGIKYYESALSIDPINNIVRTNLANLYYRNREFDKAEKAFKTIIEQEPAYGATYYSYALLLAELKRNKEAIVQMELATKYMSENTRVYYNLSLLYDGIQNYTMAEDALIRGLKIAPNEENLLYALAYLYQKNGQLDKAKNVTMKLVQLYPNNTQYYNFLQQLNQQ